MYQDTELKVTDLPDRVYRRSVIILALLVLTALTLKALLLSRFPINVDEFHYLSQVYEYKRGELSTPFQCFHVHFFGWLSAVGQNEVTQIIAARIVMYFLFLGTCFYLFRTVRHFLGTRAALFSVLCYLSFLFTIANGASFRPDTPSTFFFMFALYYFVVRGESVFSNILAGMAMAVSFLFTIKASIYLPVFAGWFLLRLWFRGGRSKYVIRTACFLGTLILVIAIYRHYSAALFAPADKSDISLLSDAGAAYSTFITLKQLFPTWKRILATLILDPITFSLLFGGIFVYVTDLRKHRYARNDPKSFLLVLLIPLSSLLIYRNAFPYFYVFLMPTAMVFCGYAFEFIASKSDKRITALVLSIALGPMLLVNYIAFFPRYIRTEVKLTRLQYDTLAAIHTIFPKPVPYVDRFSMVSSYPKVGFFITVAGMRNYMKRAEPVFPRLLPEKKPLFLLENCGSNDILDLTSSKPPKSKFGHALLEEDWAALKSYFIHHWGPVWVVGKQFNLDPAPGECSFDIIVPGLYTVESQTGIIIDGTSYHNGDVVRLEVGHHTVGSGGPATTMNLRWGDHLYRPDIERKGIFLVAPFF